MFRKKKAPFSKVMSKNFKPLQKEVGPQLNLAEFTHS
jgi:hypothetical protein